MFLCPHKPSKGLNHGLSPVYVNLFFWNNEYISVVSEYTCVFDNSTDTVRGLAVMPGLGILSASHDGYALPGSI